MQKKPKQMFHLCEREQVLGDKITFIKWIICVVVCLQYFDRKKEEKRERCDMHQKSTVGNKSERLDLCSMCCNHLA